MWLRMTKIQCVTTLCASYMLPRALLITTHSDEAATMRTELADLPRRGEIGRVSHWQLNAPTPIWWLPDTNNSFRTGHMGQNQHGPMHRGTRTCNITMCLETRSWIYFLNQIFGSFCLQIQNSDHHSAQRSVPDGRKYGRMFLRLLRDFSKWD